MGNGIYTTTLYSVSPLLQFHLFTAWKGYVTSASLSFQIWRRFLETTCSTQTSSQCCFLKSRMKRGSHSSDAIPRSLQHRVSALDLQPSPAVGIVSSEKYVHSPRAIATNLSRHGAMLAPILPKTSIGPETYRPWTINANSRVTTSPPPPSPPLAPTPTHRVQMPGSESAGT